MKIRKGAPTKAVRAPKRAKKTKEGKGSAFASHLDAALGPQEAQAPVESSAISDVEAALSVQEVGATGEERSRRLARRRVADLLDRLEDLRLQILSGTLSREKLLDLARTLRDKRPQTDDSRLNDLLDDTELRVEIEIAKLTHRS